MAQAQLFKADEEAALYHSGGRSFFTLNTRPPDGRMRQQAHRLDDLAVVLQSLNPKLDSWISQGEFIQPNRRVVNLARIGLMFVDLDFYNSPLADCTPEDVLFRVWSYLESVDLPPPSIAIDSGRGLQLKWLLEDPLPRQALPRWNACQRYLVDALKPFGADPQAKDASRILRVVQTTNSKAQRMVRVIHSPGFRYSFDDLANDLLPLTREQVQEQREKKKARLQLVQNSQAGHAGLNRFSGRRLAWDRLEDIRKLADLRGGIQEGQRMKNLFWQLNFLLLSGATNPRQMFHEAAALARKIDPAWGYGAPELNTLFSKAKDAFNGKKVEFQGKLHTSLYTPRNQTLIDLFGIEPKEEQQLRTIISKAEASKRHREREEKRRREAGAMDRQTYQSNAEAKREQARELRSQGKSIRDIAKALNCSIGAVSGYLKK